MMLGSKYFLSLIYTIREGVSENERRLSDDDYFSCSSCSDWFISCYLGKPSMIRERFSKGVSPENERKFMMATGGAIAVIGIDMMVLGFLDSMNKLDSGNKLIILAIGIVVFVGLIVYGQKKFRR